MQLYVFHVFFPGLVIIQLRSFYEASVNLQIELLLPRRFDGRPDPLVWNRMLCNRLVSDIRHGARCKILSTASGAI